MYDTVFKAKHDLFIPIRINFFVIPNQTFGPPLSPQNFKTLNVKKS